MHRMSRWTAGAVVGLLLAANAARATDLDPAERRWVRECVERLGARSDRLRGSAEAALGAMDVSVVPVVLEHLGKLDPKRDEDWISLARALDAMGAAAAAAALRERREEWPGPAAERLEEVARLLETNAVPRRRVGPAAPVAVDVRQRVLELLEPFRTVNEYARGDPRVTRVVALGREAIPVVVELLREAHAPRTGMLDQAAADALDGLVEEQDVPLLAGLLREGLLLASRPLGRMRTPAAAEALLGAVENGFMDHELVEALRRHIGLPSVRSALVAWVRDHGAAGAHATGFAAELLAEAGVEGAAAALLGIVDRVGRGGRWRVAAALARLGEKRGLEVLIEELEQTGGGRDDDYVRHNAGNELNELTGLRHFQGTPIRGRMARFAGNFAEAAGLYRQWWRSAQPSLRFDPNQKKWLH